MILEMDCGNSFIKWRVLDGALAVAGGVVDSDAGLIAAVLAVPALRVTRCRLVSVRSDAVTTGEHYRYQEPYREAGDDSDPETETESGAFYARLHHERDLN